MKTRPTITTVSQKAGVSVSTVSQVLRGSGRISQQTRDKVLQAARAVNYIRDSRAAAMRSGQNKEVGLLVQHIDNPFNAEVLAGVTRTLEQHDYLVFVLDAQDDAQRQQRYLEMLAGHAKGGFIWVPTQHTPTESSDLLRQQHIPTVTFLRSMPGQYFDHVSVENTQATRDATRYLIEQGHRHIAFFGGQYEIESRMQRISGYLTGMHEATLPTIVWPTEDSKRGGAEGLPALLAEHPEVTALICVADTVALGACLGLSRLGKETGNDVAVIGFDNIEEAALWTPALTTLAINPYQLGEQLAQTLLDRIDKPDAPVRHIHLPAQLILRETA